MDEITLSRTEFKALASDSRTGIIKLLNERNHTLSEISKKMELTAPTVKQHLSVLENAGLIQQIDEGRKWKYYCLTKKGSKILSPGSLANVFIVLGLSIIGVAAVLYSFFVKGSMQLAAAPLANGAVNDMGNDAVKSIANSPAAEEFSNTAGQVVADQVPAALASPVVPSIETIALALAGLAFFALIVLSLAEILKKK
ncbi:MAG: winged helix-turn-helix domain-containing protein [archaeon]|jgi:DNA-binding transcriptional ArsR family regulator|nr:winged helix-turn-helix domain-containing protein [archaeon]